METRTFKDFLDLARFLARREKSMRESPSPTLWRLRLLVPLSILSSGKQFSALELSTERPVDPKELLDQVIWRACFRGIQTLDWFVAFELISKFFMKKMQIDHKLSWYIGVLFESSPRGGTWFSNHPPLRKGRLANRRTAEVGEKRETVLDRITRELSLVKPSKFIEISVNEVTVQYPKADKPRFIGVGYKDKGNIGKPGLKPGEVPLSDYDFVSLQLNEEDELKFSKALQQYFQILQEYGINS